MRKVKIEKRTSQIDLLDSVASKAKVLNQSAAAFGDPLAYRAVLARVFAVTPDDVRWVARSISGRGESNSRSTLAKELRASGRRMSQLSSRRTKSLPPPRRYSMWSIAPSCLTSALLQSFFRPISNACR